MHIFTTTAGKIIFEGETIIGCQTMIARQIKRELTANKTESIVHLIDEKCANIYTCEPVEGLPSVLAVENGEITYKKL